MTGNRGAGTATVFLFNDPAKLVNGHFATTHLEKGTHNGTHHIAQEAVGLNNEAPLMFTYLFPSSLHDAAIIGSHIGV